MDSYNDNEGWEEQVPETKSSNVNDAEVQRLLAELQRKAANCMRYLVLEGFLEPSETPGEYKYTPEGLVLAQQAYRKLQQSKDE